LTTTPQGAKRHAIYPTNTQRKAFYVRIDPPDGKDFNEDLQALRAQAQALKHTKYTHRDVDILPIKKPVILTFSRGDFRGSKGFIPESFKMASICLQVRIFYRRLCFNTKTHLHCEHLMV